MSIFCYMPGLRCNFLLSACRRSCLLAVPSVTVCNGNKGEAPEDRLAVSLGLCIFAGENCYTGMEKKINSLLEHVVISSGAKVVRSFQLLGCTRSAVSTLIVNVDSFNELVALAFPPHPKAVAPSEEALFNASLSRSQRKRINERFGRIKQIASKTR